MEREVAGRLAPEKICSPLMIPNESTVGMQGEYYWSSESTYLMKLYEIDLGNIERVMNRK